MEQFKQFLITLAAFAAALCLIVSSACAINTGKGFFIVCGILNLSNIYPVIKFAINNLKNK